MGDMKERRINLFLFVFHLHRGTGLIINISSQVGIHPQPLLSLYCASKVLSLPSTLLFICMYSFKHTHETNVSDFDFLISDFCNVFLSVSAC